MLIFQGVLFDGRNPANQLIRTSSRYLMEEIRLKQVSNTSQVVVWDFSHQQYYLGTGKPVEIL